MLFPSLLYRIRTPSWNTAIQLLYIYAMQPWDLLASDAVKGFIEEALSRKYDALQVSTALHKAGYSNGDRATIMDYKALVPKFREKFFAPESAKTETARGMFLLCDKLALEQSTAQDIGRWKAGLWPSEGSVHDLCCGMGGDSFFLPAGLKLTGVDLDEREPDEPAGGLSEVTLDEPLRSGIAKPEEESPTIS